MGSVPPSSEVSVPRIVIGCALLLVSCATTGKSPPPTPTVVVAPMCILLATTTMINPTSDVTTVSERTDPTAFHGFRRLHAMSGPRGNSTVGFRPEVYGTDEAWLRNPFAPAVFRAQSHPARRPNSNDFAGSAWSITAQNASGVWSRVLTVGSANPGNDRDDPVAGGMTTPQLMPVGLANPQMFACAGERSEDDRVRTTQLIEVTPTGITPIQDLLSGDDRFVPNTPGPLRGPADPPTPTIRNLPGNPVRDGRVECAMTQLEDDVASRELHMLAISNGVLYHSMANNFGTATTGNGLTFNRFNTVSPWGDVGQALGGGFGNVVHATLVSRPRSVSVFFVAQKNNVFRLWHAVRFSAGAGSWRPADDVLALTGGNANGVVDPFRVAAGVCPMFGEEATGARPDETELVYVMYRPDRVMTGGRIVSTTRQWSVGLPGNYSPLSDMTKLMSTTSDTTRNHTLEKLVITTRPFADNAVPPPPPEPP